MKFISKFKQFESKDFESITLNDVSLQDIYDYLYEDDRILYELYKDRGKIITFSNKLFWFISKYFFNTI